MYQDGTIVAKTDVKQHKHNNNNTIIIYILALMTCTNFIFMIYILYHDTQFLYKIFGQQNKEKLSTQLEDKIQKLEKQYHHVLHLFQNPLMKYLLCNKVVDTTKHEDLLFYPAKTQTYLLLQDTTFTLVKSEQQIRDNYKYISSLPSKPAFKAIRTNNRFNPRILAPYMELIDDNNVVWYVEDDCDYIIDELIDSKLSLYLCTKNCHRMFTNIFMHLKQSPTFLHHVQKEQVIIKFADKYIVLQINGVTPNIRDLFLDDFSSL